MRSFAFVAMPKAAMNKNDLSARAKYEVRLSGKLSPVKAVAIAHPVD
jgi:hypothetical protein